MAINLKFDLSGNPELPTIILANRNGNKLGQLKVNADSVDLSDRLNDASELSFTVNKYIDGKLTPLWDKLTNFKLIYCKEWDCWFEIKVELDEETEAVKTVFCTQLGQAELSQIMLYNVEINTEDDIARDDYKMSILWDEKDAEVSILDRVLEKAPHYSIIHVDDTIKNIQRSFSFDGTSIYDAFQEIGEEIGCLFVYHSNSGENGKIQRTISVYDLERNCLNPDCKHRGEFTDKCPKCGGTNIRQGFGRDTLIFVTADELASEGIQLTTDTDSVKNCFKLEGGDDLMTATIRNCNPNGTDYIWYFSDAVKEDMSEGLVDKLNSYNGLYKDYYNNHESKLDMGLVNKYNALVKKYEGYYNTKSTCLNCDYEGFFENACPECGSTSILSGKKLQSIPSTIKGYSALMNTYYNTIDLALYLKSGLMPTVEMSDTSAQEQAKLLTADTLSPVAVNTQNKEAISLATANSAVLSMAKIVVKPTYKVEVKTSTLSNSKIWEGSFVVTNYSDENDTVESNTVKVVVNNDTETFVRQKLDKALNKDNTDDYSISGLFEKEYDEFCEELKRYALNPLKSFYDSCDTCINILIDNGAGDKDKKPDLYEKLYEPYYKKSSAIADEIKIRESEIAIIEGVWDETGEENPELITNGLQQYIEECRNEIQDVLDFQKYLGEELWLELCCYRREDTYSNENYISDGLNNADLFEKALEFIEVAENEIYKSAELQHSISADLNNLLAIEKFKPLVESFEVGNWIRVQVDDEIFKLRLLEYGIDFGNFDNISVEFSDVTKIKNGITDVKDIIEQASSMATSYDSVQRQAKQGKEAQGTVDKWLTRGLNSALVQIQNNDDEEITLTKNGLLGRSYDDISGVYSPKQFRLTHNIMAYTADNWETVSAALGEHEYTKWANNQWVQDIDYGLSSKFVTAGYITGSQIIGGEIVSSNYNPIKTAEREKEGTYINLLNGDFDFGGGKIVYNKNDNTVTLSGVTIQWDNVNKPTVENIDGLSGLAEDIRTIEQGLQATTINSQYVISPNIVGGYLNIKNNNNVGVVIDPNADYILRVYNGGGTTTIGVDKDGNASFSGEITADGGTIGGWEISSNDLVRRDVNQEPKVIISGSGYQKKYYKVGAMSERNDWTIWANGNFGVTNDGKMYASDGNISGWNLTDWNLYKSKYNSAAQKSYAAAMTTESRAFAVYEKDGNCLTEVPSYSGGWAYNFYVSYDGELFANKADITGKITATSGEIGGCSIEDGTLKIANANIDSLNVSKISAGTNNNAITFTNITADGGTIGGWTIASNSLKYTTETANGVGVAGTMYLCPAGTTTKKSVGGSDEIMGWGITVGDAFGVTTEGALYANNATIQGKLTAGEYSKIGDFEVDNNSIFSGAWGTIPPDVFMCIGSQTPYSLGGSPNIKGWAFGAGSNFGVTNTGALYCRSGKIGGWEIDENHIVSTKDVSINSLGTSIWSQRVYLKPDGVEVNLTYKSGNPVPTTTEYDLFISWYDLVDKLDKI